ncbi:hypothetical protein BSKO_05007 [Bryopsis sp. KO-2023]|nr:hypothetical protein BSKO_05007 [Bryopsis sp. KO-2023]
MSCLGGFRCANSSHLDTNAGRAVSWKRCCSPSWREKVLNTVLERSPTRFVRRAGPAFTCRAQLSDPDYEVETKRDYWLTGSVQEDVSDFARSIENQLFEAIGNDLANGSVDPRMEFIDSMNPFGQIDDPSSSVDQLNGTDSRLMRMIIENRFYESTKFRKIDIELARRQDKLQVLHCIMVPRIKYDLPIFACDMVGAGRVNFAAVDLTPSSLSAKLPEALDLRITERMNSDPSKSWLEPPPKSPESKQKRLPEWFAEMSSDRMRMMAPKDKNDIEKFSDYALMLLEVYLEFVCEAEEAPEDRLGDIKAAHKRFFHNNLQNIKTRAALKSCFGEEFTEYYMSEVMFDYQEC